MPRSRALRRIFSRFMPRPSSRTSMTMEPPWWEAARVSVPASDLPAAMRCSGISMPWSSELRTRWVSGSVIFSTRPLSSSVASPCNTRSNFLPILLARSRSMRGKRLKTVDMGIMRIDITHSCRSRVLRSRSARPASSCWLAAGSSVRLFCASMAWVITSSPARLISWSTLPRATRMLVDSMGPPRPAWPRQRPWLVPARDVFPDRRAHPGKMPKLPLTMSAASAAAASTGAEAASTATACGEAAAATGAAWEAWPRICTCSLATWKANRSSRSSSLDWVCTPNRRQPASVQGRSSMVPRPGISRNSSLMASARSRLSMGPMRISSARVPPTGTAATGAGAGAVVPPGPPPQGLPPERAPRRCRRPVP
ncbi:Uncharacterised protein [Comamonas terrigena]|nr:Uncharacterised protein [Comamonas terrigena]